MNANNNSIKLHLPKTRSHWRLWLFLSISFMSFLFIMGCFYNAYASVNHNDIFKDIDIYQPSSSQIKLEFKNKNITFRHNINSKHVANSLFDLFNSGLKYESLAEDYLHLHDEKLSFEVKKLDPNNLTIEKIVCLNVSLRLHGTGQGEACADLGEHSWYGGHESLDQPYWPINDQTFDYVPYVTGFPDIWSAVTERYWLSSVGLAIFFDDNIPLFVKHTQNPNQICFQSAKSKVPYKYTPVFTQNLLAYSVCTGPFKSLHLHMLQNFMSIPTSRPDQLMMKLPVFTTWNYYFRAINQTVVLNFANEIRANNYSLSQLEIDDKWEVFYGDLDFDKKKFPDMNELTSQLHAMDMRVTLWVHPFCNIDSSSFIPGTIHNYWVMDESGTNPALTSWWNGPHSAILGIRLQV